MGYRSDVTAVFYVAEGKHLPVLKLWLQENFPMDVFNDNIRWFDRGMIFEDNSVKWYDDYDDIKAFNHAVEKYLDLMGIEGDDPPKFSYEFIRIGENYDDVETEWYGDHCEYMLGVSRSVTIELQEDI